MLHYIKNGETSSGYVCIVTAWSLSCNSEYNSSIRAMYYVVIGSLWPVCPGVLSSSVCLGGVVF